MKFKMPLSVSELENQILVLSKIFDAEIDFSDIPKLDDSFFNNAVRAKFYRPAKSTPLANPSNKAVKINDYIVGR